mmetsp:Transcript_69258/g.129310  ORF Transcript_69258/g.129310 Transcript_69258/m.129310 type:complete len:197 (-) Transcript_69258:37-627(-)
MTLQYRLLGGEDEGQRKRFGKAALGVSLLAGLCLCMGVLCIDRPRLAGGIDWHAPAPAAAVEKESAVAVVEQMVAAWTAGGDIYQYYADDVVVDVTGPNLPEYKVYKGLKSFKGFITWLDSTFAFSDVKFAAASGTVPGEVFLKFSLMAENKETKKDCRSDLLEEYEVKDGKILYTGCCTELGPALHVPKCAVAMN